MVGRIELKTMAVYNILVSLSLGLVLVNVLKPEPSIS
jgi:hypothetical protein